VLIILIIVINYFGLFRFEGFRAIQSNGTNILNQNNKNASGQNNKNVSGQNNKNASGQNQTRKNNFVSARDKLNHLKKTHRNNRLELGELDRIEKNVLFNNKDYNENLSIDNKDNKYFYTDMINQSNINETAFNIIYSIDPIDYSDVKTGAEKCDKKCNGVCFENGYDGIATCYPPTNPSFDWGTLYKNPTFTYGYNAFGPNHLPQ
jgi:hypothetical protein